MNKKEVFSKAKFWEVQREQYFNLGPKCWSQHLVPSQITSSPLTASYYAELVLSILNQAPRPILELGGGSGEFAFHFLVELLKQKPPPFTYYLSDFSDHLIDFYHNHPKLKPFLSKGLLKILKLDVENDPIEFEKPLIVIANYFFDTIQQDLFKVTNHQIYQGLVDASCESYSFKPLKNPSPFLIEYANTLHNTPFLFPTGAFDVIEKLPQDSLIIIGDKGPVSPEAFRLPKFDWHQTFSLPVNFHALKVFVEARGGSLLLPKAEKPHFTMSILFTGKNLHSVKACYDKQQHKLHPQELLDQIRNFSNQPSAAEGYALLKKSLFDPRVYLLISEEIDLKLTKEEASEVQKKIYPLSENEAFIFSLLEIFSL
ncbi:MAG: hypothetical protein WDZ28_01095 [Simkaniaceae bacterium]